MPHTYKPDCLCSDCAAVRAPLAPNTVLYVVVCAWCPDGKAMTQAFLDRDVPVTHGICPTCLEKLNAEITARKQVDPDW